MPARLNYVRNLLPLLFLLTSAATSPGQPAASSAPAFTPADAHSLVARTLANELRAAQDTSHLMRYRLRKSTPRLVSAKEILETRDGAVARLLSIADKPLSPDLEQKEEERLNGLLRDPSRQHHRKQSQDEDIGRALKVIRVLPTAFLYHFAGTIDVPGDKVEKFSFKPNPAFEPPDLETQILGSMAGELWIDATQGRVVRLEGHLTHDVNFGWGILGRLNKGGWIVIDQADVGGHQWRTVRFQMVMSGRVLFKNKSFDTVEEQTQYAPLPSGLDYKQAIEMLRTSPGIAERASR